MKPIFEQSDHQRIRGTKELLRQDARGEINGIKSSVSSRVRALGGTSGKDHTELLIRIISNTLTRGERLTVRSLTFFRIDDTKSQ